MAITVNILATSELVGFLLALIYFVLGVDGIY